MMTAVQACNRKPGRSPDRKCCNATAVHLAVDNQEDAQAWDSFFMTKLWQANNSWLSHAVTHL